jgi:uncharacterized protein (TIGR03067 family)
MNALILSLHLLAVGAGVEEAEAYEMLIGEWRLVAAEKNGQPMSKVEIGQAALAVLRIDRTGFSRFSPGGSRMAFSGEIELDVKKELWEITFTDTQREITKGIFENKGDTLRLCLAEINGPPKAFKAEKRSFQTLLEYVRDEKGTQRIKEMNLPPKGPPMRSKLKPKRPDESNNRLLESAI